MALEKIHEKLAEFDMDQEEAEIIVFLTAMGPCPARTISSRFDFNRMKTYRTLKSMEEKGLVHRIMGRPMKYVAIPLEDLLDTRIEDARRKLDEMRSNEDFILEEITKIASSEVKVTEGPRFRFYQGRQQVYEFMTQMWSNVEEDLSLITTSPDLLRLSLWGLDGKLLELSKEGKKIRILTDIDESNIQDIERLIDRFEIRHLETDTPVRLVVIDQEEVLTSVVMDDSMSMTTQDDTGLWTSASSFASAMRIFYDSLWSLAPDARTVINSIRTGERPQEFKTIRNKRDCESTFKLMIERCSFGADILVRRLQDLPLPLDHFAEILEDKNLRIISNLDESLNELLNTEVRPTILRHNVVSSNLLLLIVDSNELLMSTKDWNNSGQAVWSNTTAYVDSMRLVFGDYWENGVSFDKYYSEVEELENLNELAISIGNELQDNGWLVKVPGSIKGKSGVDYPFTLSARHPTIEDVNYGLKIARREDAFNQIMELSVRRLDLECMIILSSLEPFDNNVLELANLYGIKLVHGEEAGTIARNLINFVLGK